MSKFLQLQLILRSTSPPRNVQVFSGVHGPPLFVLIRKHTFYNDSLYKDVVESFDILYRSTLTRKLNHCHRHCISYLHLALYATYWIISCHSCMQSYIINRWQTEINDYVMLYSSLLIQNDSRPIGQAEKDPISSASLFLTVGWVISSFIRGRQSWTVISE